MGFKLMTPRLRIRSWRQDDVASWGELCADPEVMRYFPKTLTPVEAMQWIDNQQRIETKHGYCFWAIDLRDSGAFIGMTGLHPLHIEGIISDGIEIGWRLHRAAWNKGYATEAAKACRDYARDELRCEKLYAVASEVNVNSIAIMKKLEMEPVRKFVHPLLPLGSALQPCVLYSVAFC